MKQTKLLHELVHDDEVYKSVIHDVTGSVYLLGQEDFIVFSVTPYGYLYDTVGKLLGKFFVTSEGLWYYRSGASGKEVYSGNRSRTKAEAKVFKQLLQGMI